MLPEITPDAKICITPGLVHGLNLEVSELFYEMMRAWIHNGPLPWEMKLGHHRRIRQSTAHEGIGYEEVAERRKTENCQIANADINTSQTHHKCSRAFMICLFF